MHIDILTLFPEMFRGVFSCSMVKRAGERGLLTLGVHNFREFAHDTHKTVDDYPYGGGPGMVLKPGPLFEAVEAITGKGRGREVDALVVLLSPQGRLLDTGVVEELARKDHLVLLCGHYEGVDDRVREHLVADEISVGDYVLSGGEIPSMVIVDAVSRVLSGVLGSAESVVEESHQDGLLEYPQYTRPATYRGWGVPEVLLSGNHNEITRWRRREALRRTLERRPDLLRKATLGADDLSYVEFLEAARGGAQGAS